MQLLLGSLHYSRPGGAVTYLATVASVLQRLGHEVTIFTKNPGMMADAARKGGLSVAVGAEDLPGDVDGVLAHDPVMAYTLLGRYPRAPQIFVCHAGDTPATFPPQLAGGVSAVVVMNDRVHRCMEAMALEVPIVRLRQPIDYERFRPLGAVRDHAREALLLGNYLQGEKRDMVTAACAAADLRWTQLGGTGHISVTPESAIADADIVVGYGRSILEAMSAARAAYVFDYVGGDGWVTPERYERMEADGFAGTAFAEVPDADRITRDLGAYTPAMGQANSELVVRHHDPFEHASELVALLERVGARGARSLGPVEEMARLARLQWDAHWRAEHLAAENVALRRRLEEAYGRLHEVTMTRRWRAVQGALRPLDTLRRRLRPGWPREG